MRPVLICDQRGERRVSQVELREFNSACRSGRWEVEIGFGKGRFILDRASRNPSVQWLGIEVAAKYYRLVCQRRRRRELDNVTLLCGEAGYILATMLPTRFADRLHVYFPDPWPKDRHSRRRLFERDNLDLLLALLRPGGELLFASDHPEYGARVEELLRSHPALEVRDVEAWEDGSRTNYETKFVAQGLPIRRLIVRLVGDDLRHPEAAPASVAISSPAAVEGGS